MEIDKRITRAVFIAAIRFIVDKMLDVKVKLRVSHRPSENPGVWCESKLLLKVKGSKWMIKKLEKLILVSLAEVEQKKLELY